MVKAVMLVGALLVAAAAFGEDLRVGAPAPVLRLDGTNGGLASGGPWSSASVRDRVHVLFYVDPDERDLNEHVGQALAEEHFADELFGTVAVINMAATWIPNWVLGRMLRSKQRQYPRTVYVKDFERVFVTSWGLADDSYDIVVLDARGIVRFVGTGRLSPDQTNELIAVVKEAINELRAE